MFSKSIEKAIPLNAGRRNYVVNAFVNNMMHVGEMHKLTIPCSGGEPKRVSAEEAVGVVRSGDRVFVHSVASSPRMLIEALVDRHKEIEKVEVCHIHTEQEAIYNREEYAGSFRNNNFFCGSNVRKSLEEGRSGYVPIFLSEVPLLFKRGILPLDVALLQVSPPDKHGFCSMGTSVDVSVGAAESAKILIAQINPNHPRTHGDGTIHISCLDYIVDCNDPLPTLDFKPLNEKEIKIGKYISDLIPNGATLQMGIGSIPNAVLDSLKNHKDLGIHSEMISDGAIDLIQSGVVNNSKKITDRHFNTVSFVIGSKRLYDFLDDNPSVVFRRIEYVNDPSIIRQNSDMIAINSCIEVDLSGQVVSDSIGTRIYSGVGGQLDFIRGSSLSFRGKPILALPSVTKNGLSRIVPFINEGAGVVTTRAHVHYIVTEFGVAYLYGANLHQRAQRLISIAHPDHRESLEKVYYNRYKDSWRE